MQNKKGFNRSGDQVVIDVLKRFLINKCNNVNQQINKNKHIKQQMAKVTNFPSQNSNMLMMSMNYGITDVNRLRNNRNPLRTDYVFRRDQQNQNQMMLQQNHLLFDPNQTTSESLKQEIIRKCNELKKQINDFAIKTQCNSFSSLQRVVTQTFVSQINDLKFYLSKQVEALNNVQKMTTIDQLKNIIDPPLKQKYETLKIKIEERFKKASQIINQIKNSKDNILKPIQNEMKIFELKAFVPIKTQLMTIAIQQKKQFPTIDYKKIKKLFQVKELTPFEIDKMSSIYNIAFNQKTFTGLQQRGWLHNSVIDNYIEYLKSTQGYNSLSENANKSKLAIFSNGQSQMFQNSQNYNFNGRRIFTYYERVGMVINLKDDHWFFIGIIPKKGKLIIFDSIPKVDSQYVPYLQRMRKFIKKQQQVFKSSQSIILNQVQGITPKQNNGSDCGLHVLWNLTLFLNNKDENKLEIIQFDPRNNPILRIAMHHFMVYLLSLNRQKSKNVMPNYSYLQYSSFSVMLKPQGILLWS